MGAELRFPQGFLWGAATSAHQVEGGQDNDWSAWERGGKIRDGSVSGPACDQWHRYREDLDLAASLHVNAYRFSVEWSRIEPRPGMWNEAALEHYRDVVAAGRERGLEPFVTLWHFTHPRWFAERGGWEASDAPALFARYAERVAQGLPDVRFWMTLNEPNVHALLGYLIGEWPPEVRAFRRAWRVHDHLAVGHRLAYERLKRLAPKAQVGFAHNLAYHEPSRPSFLPDRWATQFSNAVYNQRFPRRLRGEFDFFGVNHYHHHRIRFGSLRRPVVNEPQGQPQSDFGWQIYPEAMYRVVRIAQAFGKPIYITENGIADAADRWRADYIRNYLAQVHRAWREGVDVRGYFHWSLLDNFEWREGFSKRFGLAAVDFATQRRTVRPSARVYAEICRTNRLMVEATFRA